MPDQNQQGAVADPGAAPAAPGGEPGTGTRAGATPTGGAPAAGRAGRVFTMSAHDLRKHRSEAKAEGEKAAAARIRELEAKIAALAAPPRGKDKGKAQGRPTTTQPSGGAAMQAATKQDRKAQERAAREAAKLAQERDALKSRVQAAERAQRLAHREAIQAKAEREIIAIAASKGVKDMDYVLHMVRKRTEGLTGATAEEQKKFQDAVNSGAFFEELRPQHPYLFGEVRVPANTGGAQPTQGAAPPPAPPKPGEAPKGDAIPDLTNASPAEIAAYAKSLKLTWQGGRAPSVQPSRPTAKAN